MVVVIISMAFLAEEKLTQVKFLALFNEYA